MIPKFEVILLITITHYGAQLRENIYTPSKEKENKNVYKDK